MTNKDALKRGSNQSTVISHRSSVGRKKKIRLDYPIESSNDELETLKRQDTDPNHTRANTEVRPYIRKSGEICELVNFR